MIRKESGTEKSLDEIVGLPTLTHSEPYLISVAAIRCTVLSKLPMKLWRGRSGPLQKREVSRRRSTFWHHLVERVVSMLVRLLRSVGFFAKMSHINCIGVVTGNPKSVDSQVFIDSLRLWPCPCRPVRKETGCHVSVCCFTNSVIVFLNFRNLLPLFFLKKIKLGSMPGWTSWSETFSRPC